MLAGSAYLEMALILCSIVYGQVPVAMGPVQFKRAVILTDDDATISSRLKDAADGTIGCEFYEGVPADTEEYPSSSCCTVAGIRFGNPARVDALGTSLPIAELQSRATNMLEGKDFYQALGSRGNQYGPEYRGISRIWLGDGEALGELRGGQHLHPGLLDSFAQLLSCLSDAKGRTYVLSSLEEVRIYDLDLPEHAWGHARLREGAGTIGTGFFGDVRVSDSSGACLFELVGVKCGYLDRAGPDPGAVGTYRIYIASTFTASPLEDPLDFWSRYLGIRSEVRFASYGQVFQELLDPQSIFRMNRHGANIALVGLEDWATGSSSLTPVLSRAETERVFADKARYVLPNGLKIAHLNKYETDYLFQEIFLDECYLRNGIALEDGATVVDIGANIGMFTLFVGERCRGSSIYAYEPSPVAHELLHANCGLYGLRAKTFCLGVSDRRKTGRFTFYKNASVFSTFQASQDDDREAIHSVMRNMLKEGASAATGPLDQYADEMVLGRLESTSFACQLVSVSDIIADNGIDAIDLLKVDAEKSELDVLRGIADADWPKIRQIVVEVHDRNGQILADVKTLLQNRRFDLAVEEQGRLKSSGLSTVFARRLPAMHADKLSQGSTLQTLQDNLHLFHEALNTYAGAQTVPVIVGVCPRSPRVAADPVRAALFDRAENQLLADIRRLASVHTISSRSFLQGCRDDQYFDPHTDMLGRIPYTPVFFASMATELARTVLALTARPYKVLALDCDNTLWKGVCGEDGSQGVALTEPYRRLQEFVIAQMESGMLVCLCSRNNQKDVLDVFDRRADMVLRREHLVAWRLNWGAKSKNLRSLAAELNVGLDSFIFIDDSPVECAEVRSSCPEVLTLQLPARESEIPRFLQDVWAFDHPMLSAEDKKRTRLYRENAQREAFCETALSLKDFLDGLGLQVSFFEPGAGQLGRVSQLTYRTNQFNFTTIRRSESQIKDLLAGGHYYCLAVDVRDRFGDYGLVGLVIYQVRSEALVVDTFLLSCRVLGRGVEHRIVAELARLATDRSVGSVEMPFIPSGRNQPALDFMSGVGSRYQTPAADGFLFRMPTEALAAVKYEPSSSDGRTAESAGSAGKEAPGHSEELSADRNGLWEKMQEIAEDLHEGQAVLDRLEAGRREQLFQGEPDTVQAGASPERQLAVIWQKVLGRRGIGLTDSFFQVGGTSLRGVQLIALVKKTMGVNLPLTTLFECPTIALMAAKLGSRQNGSRASAVSNDAVTRGARRREAGVPRRQARPAQPTR